MSSPKDILGIDNGAVQTARDNQDSTDSKCTPAKKPVRRLSYRKIEANRRNAKKSTGPKTPRGKRIVSRNAVKHGILAKEVTSDFNVEETAEFDDLLQRFRRHYEPVGIEENLWVQEITRIWWSKKLAARSYRGEQEKQQAVLLRDRRRAHLLDIKLGLLWAVAGYRDERQEKLHTTTIGIGVLMEFLESKKSILESATLSTTAREQLIESLTVLFCRMWPTETDELIAAIEEERTKLETEQRIAAMTEDLEESASSAFLPTKETLDLLLRYERAIDRRLEKAIARLEELQRRRNKKTN